MEFPTGFKFKITMTLYRNLVSFRSSNEYQRDMSFSQLGNLLNLYKAFEVKL